MTAGKVALIAAIMLFVLSLLYLMFYVPKKHHAVFDTKPVEALQEKVRQQDTMIEWCRGMIFQLQKENDYFRGKVSEFDTKLNPMTLAPEVERVE